MCNRYEDEHLLIVNKPAGMVVHPAPGSPNGTFVNALLYHLGDAAELLVDETDISLASGIDEEDNNEYLDFGLPETPEAARATPPSLRPGIVHRLDKGTTGVLIAGKTKEAVAKMCTLFAQRKVRKVYLALCVGHPGETTIVEPIGRSKKNRQIMTIYDGPPGKSAVTHLRTVCFDGKISAVLARIETGRTHQIRVHLKYRQTPILGDDTYGSDEWNHKYRKILSKTSESVEERPLLHSYETEFVHPFTGKSILGDFRFFIWYFLL
jgi:23S rRNA pseudouridine1911/1915/1917 synthase